MEAVGWRRATDQLLIIDNSIENKGFVGGCNQGLREAFCDVVLVPEQRRTHGSPALAERPS